MTTNIHFINIPKNCANWMNASCWFLCPKKSAITFGEGCMLSFVIFFFCGGQFPTILWLLRSALGVDHFFQLVIQIQINLSYFNSKTHTGSVKLFAAKEDYDLDNSEISSYPQKRPYFVRCCRHTWCDTGVFSCEINSSPHWTKMASILKDGIC